MATRVLCFRAGRELAARIENRAFLEGLTEAQLIAKALKWYLGFPPEERQRRQLEAVLCEVMMCNPYLTALVQHTPEVDEFCRNLPEWERLARERARAQLDALDQDPE
jgi:hypothetical protein